MSLTEALELLGSARLYVRQGEEIVSRQRRLMDSLESFGHDLTQDILILEQLEEMQSQYIKHRDCLERQVLRLLRPEADSHEPDEDIRF